MKLWEFIRELAFYFPLSGTDEAKNKTFDMYVENLEGIAITNKCEYDWKKVLKVIQCTYTFKSFPSLADIIKVLPECRIIKPYKECKGEGSVIILTLPTGSKYLFVVSGIGRPITDIQAEIKEKFGSESKIEHYPKGTVLIGDEILLP